MCEEKRPPGTAGEVPIMLVPRTSTPPIATDAFAEIWLGESTVTSLRRTGDTTEDHEAVAGPWSTPASLGP